MVIASLLKQLHNPGLSTSLPPDVARLSPTPNEQKPIDKAIMEWIEKAQASVRSVGADGAPGYRLVDGRPWADNDQSSDPDSSEQGLGSALRSTTKSPSGSSRNGSGLAAPSSDANKLLSNSPKLHSLPMENTPIGLLADLSLRDSKSRSRSASAADPSEAPPLDPAEDQELGVARPDYFQPGKQGGFLLEMFKC